MHPRNLRKHLSIEQRVRHREGAARERRKGQVVVKEVLAELQACPKVGLVVCDVCPVDEVIELGLRLRFCFRVVLRLDKLVEFNFATGISIGILESLLNRVTA